MANSIDPAVFPAMGGIPLAEQSRGYYFLSDAEAAALQSFVLQTPGFVGYAIGRLGAFTAKGSFTTAFDAWASVADLGQAAGQKSSIGDPTAQILIARVDGPLKDERGTNLDGVVGRLSDGRQIILFQSDHRYQDGSSVPGYFDMGNTGYSTILHEIGHALGLAHSRAEPGKPAVPFGDSEQYTLMSYNDYSNTAVTPQLFDIGVISDSRMYGPNTLTRAASGSIYRFMETQGVPIAEDANGQTIHAYVRYDGKTLMPMVSLFDVATAGDGDTIDTSAVTSTGVQINLNGGTFSKIGSTTENVSIAYGTVIENWIGTGRGDRATGNEVANVLDGRAGNDRLEGAGGNDTLIGGLDRDVYVVGQAQDTLFDSDGKGFIIDETGRHIGGLFLKSGAQYVSVADPTLTATFNSPLTIQLPNAASVIVDGFVSDELGIRLVQQMAQAAAPGNTKTGTPGANYLLAATGGSLLDGQGAGDYLAGGAGNDRLLGGDGVDYLSGNLGANWSEGGAGGDVIILGAGTGYANGGDGDDLIAYLGADLVPPGMTGIEGQGALGIPFRWDGIVVSLDAAGNYELLDFRAGFQPLADGRLPGLSSFVTQTSFAQGLAQEVHGGLGIDVVRTGPGNDLVFGDAGADVLLGGGGNDSIVGGDDNDQLAGNAGADYLDGGAGIDQMRGEAGADHLFGGAGNDIVYGDSPYIDHALDGDDFLSGGVGDDSLSGDGAGRAGLIDGPTRFRMAGMR